MLRIEYERAMEELEDLASNSDGPAGRALLTERREDTVGEQQIFCATRGLWIKASQAGTSAASLGCLRTGSTVQSGYSLSQGCALQCSPAVTDCDVFAADATRLHYRRPEWVAYLRPKGNHRSAATLPAPATPVRKCVAQRGGATCRHDPELMLPTQILGSR